MVVSSHPVATQIGLNVLQNGGNAVDAAVATGLALGVVDQFNSGVGGGGYMVIRMSDGAMFAIDGRETAPLAASRDMYLREGEYRPSLSRRGPLAVAVPGLLAAYLLALDLAGTRPLGELIDPSVTVARDGFVLDGYYVSRYRSVADELRKDPASALIYFRPDGSLMGEGDTLKQPDLAETYERIAAGGLDYFYRGEFAQRLEAYMAIAGGLITAEDMARYRAVAREPVVGRYRDMTVIGMGPSTSGGVHVIEILNMIEASRILEGKRSWNNASMAWTARFMGQAFEDRARFLGDVDYVDVPVRRLTGQSYADSLASLLVSGNTTNLCVVDRWGNAVTVNQSINLTFGAAVTVPGTGVVLNSEMDDFSVHPEIPNYFGLVGNGANAIEPGKRPLSSMAPIILARDDRPVLLVGGAGGPRIITAVVQTIVGVVDFGLPLSRVLSQPRFHYQSSPSVLLVESGMPPRFAVGQRLRGYRVEERKHLARVHAIAWDEKEQVYVGAADPRSNGAAAGY
ncbi:MAG: gamma-glutamyltransferase [Fidelibacterota bacterium]